MIAQLTRLVAVAVAIVWIGACSSDGGEGTTECTPGETGECFAQDATMAVGICVAGERVCQAGGAWGTCEGAGVPQVEDCSDPLDEDCDGFACSEPSWSMQFGAEGDGGPRVNGLATAEDGSIYVISDFNGTLTLDDRSITSVGGVDVLLVKLDGNGQTVWAKHYGTPQNDQIKGVAVDSEGNVVFAGSTAGNIDLGGGPIQKAGDSEIFLAKLDSQGNHLLSTHATTHVADDPQLAEDPIGERYVRGMVLLADDSVVLVGTYLGDWGCLANNPACIPLDPAADLAAYIQKYDPDFVPDWRNTYDSTGRDDGLMVTRNGSGGVIWGGRNTGSFEIAGTTLPAAGAFVASTDGAGGDDWAVHFANTEARDVSAAAAGEALIALKLDGATTVAGDPLLSDGSDGLLVRLGASGDVVSYFHAEGAGDQIIGSVTMDDDGNVIMTGYFTSSLSLGGEDLTSPDSAQASFVAAMTTEYQHRWSRGFFGSSNNRASRVRRQPGGLIIVGGEFEDGSIDLGAGVLSTTSVVDAFIAAFQP